MDVQDYLRRVKPQIEADELKTIIRQKIEREEYSKQDRAEGVKEAFKLVTDLLQPIAEKIEKQVEEVEKTPEVPAIEGGPEVPAIEGVEGPEVQDKGIIDPLKDFEKEDLTKIKELGLITPDEFVYNPNREFHTTIENIQSKQHAIGGKKNLHQKKRRKKKKYC